MNDFYYLSNYIKGFVVGDSYGVPFEFKSREFMELYPCTKMIGNGTHNQPLGTWSDDTSMLLATLDTLDKEIDYTKIMDNFVNWLTLANYTSNNEVFDVGITCRAAIKNFINGQVATLCGQNGEMDNGNGSLMRIAPITFYLRKIYGPNFLSNPKSFMEIELLSRLTHSHQRSIIACTFYVAIMNEIINNKNILKEEIIENACNKVFNFYKDSKEIKHFSFLKNIKKFKNKNSKNLRGSGYVVNTLECVIWIFLNENSSIDAIKSIINFGEDTDTTAALVGGLYNLFEENEEINECFEKIRNKELIIEILNKFS